jgi:putative ATP-dependent endonuclease of OLD family
MHQLSEIRIENFRSCQNVALSLGGCTPIVGYNNAGKSNILDALGWFVAPASLRQSDFHDPEASVAVIGVVTGLSVEVLEQLEDNHRKKIEPLVADGVLPLRRVQFEPGASTKQIKLQVPDEVAPDGTVSTWKDQPGGIPEALKKLLPEPITIGAMEDAAEDATKAKTTSTNGKLLAESTGPAKASHGAELEAAHAPLSDKLAADGTQRAEELNRFDQEATEALRPFFPGIQLHLDTPVPTVQDLFGKGTIKVSEQGRQGIRN